MVYDLEKIKEKIESKPKVYWYMITKTKAKLLVKGDTEKDTLKQLNKMLKDDESGKCEGAVIWRFMIKYHKKESFGRVSIAINNWEVSDGVVAKKAQKGRVGVVWFKDKYLRQNGWKNKYIKAIVKGLVLHNKKLNSVMPNSYQVEFEKYE